MPRPTAKKPSTVKAPGATVTTPLFVDPESTPAARALIEHLEPKDRKELVLLLLETRLVHTAQREADQREQGPWLSDGECRKQERRLRGLLRVINKWFLAPPSYALTDELGLALLAVRMLAKERLELLPAYQRRPGRQPMSRNIADTLKRLQQPPFDLEESDARTVLRAAGCLSA